MKLIAESGSTRTEWALVEDNHLIQRVFTEGLNPFFQTRREISRSVRLGLPDIFFKKKLEQVYYYGAGCICKNLIERTFGNAQCCRNVIHRNTLDTFQSKSFCRGHYNPFSQLRLLGRVSSMLHHHSF